MCAGAYVTTRRIFSPWYSIITSSCPILYHVTDHKLKYFTVGGTSLKNVPAGYHKAHPQAQYLKDKSWYLEYPIGDERDLDFLKHTKKEKPLPYHGQQALLFSLGAYIPYSTARY
nr:DUF2461 family protein [Blautia pseudococcoides]